MIRRGGEGARGIEELCVGAKQLTIVAPHPDDEVIGAAALIRRAVVRGQTVAVFFVTTGVPAPDFLAPEYRAKYGDYSRYSAMRSAETDRAIAKYGSIAVRRLGLRSREVISNLPLVEAALLKEVETTRDQVIISPAFEGGHPDHDLINCICNVVAAKCAVPHLEYLGYHWSGGAFACQQFLQNTSPVWHLQLSTSEISFKKACLQCHASQWDAILSNFRADKEAFRRSPRYGYSRTELNDRVFYEVWDCALRASEVLDVCRAYRRSSLGASSRPANRPCVEPQ